MKIIDTKNNKLLAIGTFDTSELSNYEIEQDGDNVYFMCNFDFCNYVRKINTSLELSYYGGFLICVSGNNACNISGCGYINDVEPVNYVVVLTPLEKENLLAFLIRKLLTENNEK